MVTVDGVLPEWLLQSLLATWPEQNWPGWFKYDTASSRKLASRVTGFDPLFSQAFYLMASASPVPGAFPDMTFHGAGLSEIRTGGYVRPHRDAAAHPLRHWARAASSVLFLTECQGGELVCGDRTVEPRPNLLATFDASEQHEVCSVSQGRRLSLSLFWWRSVSEQEWNRLLDRSAVFV